MMGEGSTSVASDSTLRGHGSRTCSPNGIRVTARGVLIYWHVERKSMVIHSQLLNCAASEVGTMIDGAMHHGTVSTIK